MNIETIDTIIAGNYLTSLVAAVGLARAGQKVCIINPTPTWGGYFTKVSIGGFTWDPGSISHEFTAFNNEGARDPLTYDSRKRNDVGRFIKTIEEYTRSNIEMAEMPSPKTVYSGELHHDFIMCNRLELLKNPSLRQRVAAEQKYIAQYGSSDLHPKHKKHSELFIKRSYYQASVENHGATLHSLLLEPYFYKMSALSSTRLLALYHRIAWLPLYYPETLRSQFGDSPQKLQDTFFCYPKAGYVGVLADTLVEQMKDAGVTIIQRQPIDAIGKENGKTTLSIGGNKLQAKRIIWSLAHDQLIQTATGETPRSFEKWSATLAFTTVKRDKLLKPFSVLYTPDENLLFYRASSQTISSGQDEETVRIVVEVNPDYAQSLGYKNEQDIFTRIQSDFASLGIVSDPNDLNLIAIKTRKNVLLLPSFENWKLLEEERDILLDKYPDLVFTRNVESFFTDTLNDQLIKGLKLVEQFKNG